MDTECEYQTRQRNPDDLSAAVHLTRNENVAISKTKWMEIEACFSRPLRKATCADGQHRHQSAGEVVATGIIQTDTPGFTNGENRQAPGAFTANQTP